MQAARPEILIVELAADAATVRRAAWSSTDRVVDRVGRYGGSALALALVHGEFAGARPESARAALDADDSPLVIAVGDAVARRLPTAARACIAARVPLSGQYADGHVGGDLGPHLATIASALVVHGRVAGAGAVLVIDADGSARLERDARLDALEVPARLALLRARFPGAALLATGPAGDARVPFASLANEAEPPSFVGRGGLGAVMGRAGLRAIAIHAARRPRGGARDESRTMTSTRSSATPSSVSTSAPRAAPSSVSTSAPGAAPSSVSTSAPSAAPSAVSTLASTSAATATPSTASTSASTSAPSAVLGRGTPASSRGESSAHAAPDAAVLTESVRLLARAAGGTFEARGDAPPADPGGRKGCRGCPTPCGWVFDRPNGALGARAGAVAPFGANLGLAGMESSLAVLERCDALGLDAKEVGAVLGLALRHADRLGELAPSARALRGDVAAIGAVLDEIPRGTGLGGQLALGTARLARELGVDAATVRGQTVRVDEELAALLGTCVSTRGADPMRTFAFLASDVPDRARLARLLAPWSLPPGAEDPRDSAGKGRLVAWAESFQAAVDASGFCAFSAAAALADGVLDLDALAAWIAPETARDAGAGAGRELLAAGATIALVQRDLARRLGAVGSDDRPAFAARALDEPGMLREYRRFRGLDDEGVPTRTAWDAAGTAAVLDVAGEDGPLRALGAATPIPGRDRDPSARRPGRVEVRASGPLAAALDAPLVLELDLPASVREVLAAAAASRPAAREWLMRGEAVVPIVSRAGRRLGAGESVGAGDRLDLVVALSGG